jgi:hypothetical protein
VLAVKGNIDIGSTLPETTIVEAHNATLYMVHNLSELGFVPQNTKIQFVISGHSHKPAHEQRNDVAYINPGAAGPRRFKLPVTVAMLDLGTSPYSLQFVDLLSQVNI